MIIDSPRQRATAICKNNSILFNHIEQALSISRADIIEGFILYNSEVEQLDNAVYDNLPVRVAMFMEYILPGSWHQDRQQIISGWVNFYLPKSILDIGFGAPMKYCQDYVLQAKTDCQLVLADKFESAFEFADVILSFWDETFKSKVQFRQLDLKHIEYVGDYDVYIFQDSIEHAPEPSKYLKYQVERAPGHSKFLISIPIAPLIPCHFIHWTKEQDALDWLFACGLQVEKLERVYVNPEIDTFASGLGDIYDIMVAASPLKNS